MKKFKLALGLFVIIFAALVIYQNREYFFAKQALSFTLVPEKFEWKAPAVENCAYFGGCLVIGILIAGYFGIVSKFRSIKNIKQLNKTIISQTDTIESLKAELEAFKQDQPSDNDTSITLDTENSENLLPDNEPVLIESEDKTFNSQETIQK